MTLDPYAQFGRACEVLVGNSTAGSGIVIPIGMRMKFKTCRTNHHVPNTCMIDIYNLGPSTQNRIQGEFTEVQLVAGYKGNKRLIFAGNIRHRFWRREQNDGIMHIDAADGDNDYRNTVINAAFAAGTTHMQVIDHILGKMKTTKKGSIILKKYESIRPRVISGMARDELHKIAHFSQADWSIHAGVMQFLPVEAVVEGEAIVIRSDTGMLEAPELSDKGIKVKCLLNPALRIGGTVKLDNNDFKERRRAEREQRPGAKKPPKSTDVVRRDPDGLYKIIQIEDEGDTLTPQWYSTVLCVALGTPAPTDTSRLVT